MRSRLRWVRTKSSEAAYIAAVGSILLFTKRVAEKLAAPADGTVFRSSISLPRINNSPPVQYEKINQVPCTGDRNYTNRAIFITFVLHCVHVLINNFTPLPFLFIT